MNTDLLVSKTNDQLQNTLDPSWIEPSPEQNVFIVSVLTFLIADKIHSLVVQNTPNSPKTYLAAGLVTATIQYIDTNLLSATNSEEAGLSVQSMLTNYFKAFSSQSNINLFQKKDALSLESFSFPEKLAQLSTHPQLKKFQQHLNNIIQLQPLQDTIQTVTKAMLQGNVQVLQAVNTSAEVPTRFATEVGEAIAVGSCKLGKKIHQIQAPFPVFQHISQVAAICFVTLGVLLTSASFDTIAETPIKACTYLANHLTNKQTIIFSILIGSVLGAMINSTHGAAEPS